MQLGWPLPLLLDAHGKRALEAFSRFDDVLGNLALNNSILRRVPHLELPTRNFSGGDNFKISKRYEVSDFQLAPAYNGQCRRLYATNPNHPPRTSTKDDGRSARQ